MMNTVPKLIETRDLDVAVIVVCGRVVFTRTNMSSTGESFPFLRADNGSGCYSVDDVRNDLKAMSNYSDYVAYRVDDPNYIPPIPDGTTFHDVYFEVDNNGTVVEDWVPAITYVVDNFGNYWRDAKTGNFFDFDDVTAFRYGKGSSLFSVNAKKVISGTPKHTSKVLEFHNINQFIEDMKVKYGTH